jgi:ssDNA-binding Zn-finger/Zn-ribbon topoisomerase 1
MSERKCEACGVSFQVLKDGSYAYDCLTIPPPEKLEQPNVAENAFKTGVCPLCGKRMTVT